jgi:DNA-binding CsgD family transcriptional regulator
VVISILTRGLREGKTLEDFRAVWQELRVTGARIHRPTSSGLDSLTPSERRIADLAADGASNPEIAQALFVTVKTVEMHLGNAYRKLDISSRRQLAPLLRAGQP